MMGMLLALVVGWLLGRNWDQVKQMYHDKVTAKQNKAGNVTKVED